MFFFISSNVVIRQPDSSGTIDEIPSSLMSLDVKSKGDASNSEVESGDRKSIVASPDKINTTSSVSHDATESRHQVFGYKQKMGNGMGDQGSSPWTTSSKSKKFGKKSKWKQFSGPQAPQSLPVMNPSAFGLGGNTNNPHTPQTWHGTSQQWQKGPQDPSQGLQFYGSSDHLAYQQYGQPSSMGPGNIGPGPNFSIPPTFPISLPPPSFQNPGQAYPASFAQPPIAGFPTQQQAIPPQFVPNYPPPQLPFQAYSSTSQFNTPKTDESLPKKLQQQQQQQQHAIVKDISPSKTRKSISPAKSTTLPANWKTATDPQGNIYYYHTVTRLVGL